MTFVDECNEILMRCGMSKLYPANRFENLIMLSLVSENPFEMFEDIIENSIISEPSIEEERVKFEKSVREIDYLIKGLPKAVRREIVSLVKQVAALASDVKKRDDAYAILSKINIVMQENGRRIIFNEPFETEGSFEFVDVLLKEDNMKYLLQKYGCTWEEYNPLQ